MKNPAATQSARDLIVIAVMIAARGETIVIDAKNHAIEPGKRSEVEHRKNEKRSDQMRDRKKDLVNVVEVC